ncbi:hypothetical protein A1O1_06681 [Capronia coronata CBS 617.96]|uniref:Zn(2)-C6 fungal-type domain-containing protein n=1 Tax=Capronia coronata CBS 617.96 TaxID=1182541 RepID=W9XS61_9EURO|nr:uncharacterized protein A1O1_06681 [Capronia coronata CBS 617.96]EXJ83063.1 hypothetical protein A1O1_06681 [Capronia coronata CBS 617.96]
MPPAGKHHRGQGACTECVRRKRKCDEKRPACSLCRQHNRVCQPRIFKQWKGLSGRRSKSPNNNLQGLIKLEDFATTSVLSFSPKSESNLTDLVNPQLSPSLSSATSYTPVFVPDVVLEASSGSHEYGSWPSYDPVTEPIFGVEAQKQPIGIVEDLENDQDYQQESPTSQVTTFEQAHSDKFFPEFRTSLVANPPPLPNDILDSHRNKFLWSYFVAHGIKMFLCWDPHKVDIDGAPPEPFTKVFGSMAFQSKPLRLAAMGLSAFLQGTKTQTPALRVVSSNLGRLASQALCSEHRVLPTNTHSLLQIIATAILLFLSDPQWSTSMLQLARSTAAYMLGQETRNNVIEDEYFEVVMALLRWCDICAHFSLLQSVEMSDDYIHRSIEFQEREQQASISRTFKSWIINPLYTFSTRWINPMLRLGRLTRLRQTAKKLGFSTPDEYLEKQIDELEEELLLARNEDLKACSSLWNDLPDLLLLNEAMHSATVLLFYTRLRDLPWSTPFVRRHVDIICDQTEQISPESQSSNNILFPLYVAGCEAVDVGKREQIANRLSRLPATGYWFNQETKLVSSLRHVWAIRDNSPGTTWIDWSHQGSKAHIPKVN